MNDPEILQYLFDVQGYLVLENVLDAEEVAALNHLLDAHLPPAKGNCFGSAPDWLGFFGLGPALHRSARPPPDYAYTALPLGRLLPPRPDLRLVSELHGMARGILHCDYGPTAPTSGAQPGQYYPLRDNQILNGFVVATWNLTDAGPDYGGFCCIPGSHKSNFKLPQPIADAPEQAPCVIIPFGPGWFRHLVHRSPDPRDGRLARAPPAARLALQVLRLAYGLDQRARATAGRPDPAAADPLWRAGRPSSIFPFAL